MNPQLKSARITSLFMALGLVGGSLISYAIFGEQPVSYMKKVVIEVAAADITAKVPEWIWITVKNPDGAPNGNGRHEFNDTCGIAEGSTLHQVKVVDDRVLVMYESSRGQGYGSECGNETLFFVQKDDFATMSNRYKAILKKRIEEQDEIRRLIGK